MHVVIALDSFKGTIKATEACTIVRRGILSVMPDAQILLKPMADGGEGTADALIAARGGKWISERVTGPIEGMQVEAGFAWFPDDGDALVEMAVANGLPLLHSSEQNPLRTTTYGTGQLLKRAFAQPGVLRVLLAVGGSATVDGGTGAATALGWQFLDAEEHPVEAGGGHLAEIAHIIAPSHRDWPRVEVLCDVTNPLCGPYGAARVFAPQKGATPAMVDELAQGLEHLADCISDGLDGNIRNLPGGGAAGGLAAGAVAFMNATLVPGIETVITAAGLGKAMRGADWVITGEGRFDEQSLHGKVVSGVVDLAREWDVSVAVIAGSTTMTLDHRLPPEIKMIKSAQKAGMSTEEAIARAPELLFAAAQEWAREKV